MGWKYFLSAIANLVIAIFTAMMIMFIALNMVMQCESWEDPACVTPKEMFWHD